MVGGASSGSVEGTAAGRGAGVGVVRRNRGTTPMVGMKSSGRAGEQAAGRGAGVGVVRRNRGTTPMVGMKSSGRAGEQGGGEESERWRAPGVTGEEGLREAKRCARAGLGVTLSRKSSSSSGTVAEFGCAGLREADDGD